MAADKDTSDDAIREKIRAQVKTNDKSTIASLKERYSDKGVPSITMGQVRQLIRDGLVKLQRENAELSRLLKEQEEKASAAAVQEDAMRQLVIFKTKVESLETELSRVIAEAAADKEKLTSQVTFLEQKVASIDIGDAEAQKKRIIELEDQLKAARDALAEAQKEIHRLLAELRYAEPFISPDHDGVSAASSRVKQLSSSAQLADMGERAVNNALEYVRFNEEQCRAELPKLVQRMDALGASFPSVARMVKLATLHEENRRWLGVLDDVLAG
jgi:chromosome segregation ATPase